MQLSTAGKGRVRGRCRQKSSGSRGQGKDSEPHSSLEGEQETEARTLRKGTHVLLVAGKARNTKEGGNVIASHAPPRGRACSTEERGDIQRWAVSCRSGGPDWTFWAGAGPRRGRNAYNGVRLRATASETWTPGGGASPGSEAGPRQTRGRGHTSRAARRKLGAGVGLPGWGQGETRWAGRPRRKGWFGTWRQLTRQ